MKRMFVVCLLWWSFMACDNVSEKAKVVPVNNNYSLVPLPQHYTSGQGMFVWDAQTVIVADPTFEKEAVYLQRLIAGSSRFEPAILSAKEAPMASAVYLVKGTVDHVWGKNKEAYSLSVDSTGIRIQGMQGAGIFRGIQSLRQLLPASFHQQKKEGAWGIPAVAIKDAPKFSWRGLLFDCCRHFFDKQTVKHYIDLLAYYKMNTLHWHLTEDQGWRIAIDRYPKLTEIGAWRKGEDGKPYGGFYTKEDIREIVAYANERHINIVPEIELPGHSQAAIAAYPYLSCTGEQLEVGTKWGVFKDVYCAGNDSTFQFLENVLLEVMELFPSEYIHIGGDECPKYRWEHCSKCQKRIKAEGLHDEHELQRYFIKRINQFLQKHNKRLIGWDEILEGDLTDSSVVVQSWRGMGGALKAANQGQCAISSPISHAYFDYQLNAIDLEKVYAFSPIPEGYTGDLKYILGGECNMWTEWVPNDSVLAQRIFPRLLAMSEVLWSAYEQKNYSEFYERVQQQYPSLEAMGIQYGAETVPVRLEHYTSQESINVKMLAGAPNIDLYYTMDGTKPTTTSERYEAPLPLKKSSTLKVQAFKQDKSYGQELEQVYTKHLANGIEPTLSYVYSDYYTGGGNLALTNGVRGSLNFRDGHWQAVQKVPMEITVNLKETQTISKVSTAFFQKQDSWIFLPTKIEFFVSEDGEKYQSIGVIENTISPKKDDSFIEKFMLEIAPIKAQFVRMKAHNITHCPDWHAAAGSDAWLFVDESVVE